MALAVFDCVLSGVFSACRNVFTRGQSDYDTILFHSDLNVEVPFEKRLEDPMKLAGNIQKDALVLVRTFCFQVKLL